MPITYKRCITSAVLITGLVGNTFAEGTSNTPTGSHKWVETGVGIAGSTLSYKVATAGATYGFSANAFHHLILGAGGGKNQRGTRKGIPSLHSELSAMRFWGKPLGGMYFDAGAGLGLTSGYYTSNCESQAPDGRICDAERKTTLSLPLEANIFFGRYVGFGLFTRASISAEGGDGNHITLGIKIPIGKFAHRH